MANHFDDSTRIVYYGITGTPTLKLDGAAVSSSQTALSAAFSARSQIASPLWFRVKPSVNATNDSVIIDMKIVGNQAFTGTNNKLRIFLTEIRHVLTTAAPNGQVNMDFPVCLSYPDANGMTFTHSGNTTDTVSVRGAFLIRRTGTAPYTLDNSCIIAFVQNDSTKEVFQTSYQNVSTLRYPNGGETGYIGDSLRIRWDSTMFAGNVRIFLNRTYPTGNWDTLFANTANSGSIYWRITAPATTTARIKIASVANPNDYDISKANFTIGSPCRITLTPTTLSAIVEFGDTLTQTVTVTNVDSSITYTGAVSAATGISNYTYVQTTDPGGPTAQWIDISRTGRAGPTGDDVVSDNTNLTVLPFHFPFYGQVYDTVWMCTNGWLTFNHPDSGSFRRRALPANAFRSAMVLCWNDLFVASDSGYCKWDTSADRAVFSWINVRRRNNTTSHMFFQAVLHPNGTYEFNYDSVIVNDNTYQNFAGIQSEDMTRYVNLFATYTPAYHNTVRFTYSPIWATPGLTTFNIPARQSVTLPVLFDARDASAGTYNGVFTFTGNIVPVTLPLSLTVRALSAREPVTMPSGIELENVYPNPFNPTTVVKFHLSVPTSVSMKLYDVTGRLVRTEYSGKMEAGSHAYTIRGDQLATGTYFLSFKAGSSYKQVRKLVLIK